MLGTRRRESSPARSKQAVSASVQEALSWGDMCEMKAGKWRTVLELCVCVVYFVCMGVCAVCVLL